MIYDLTYQRLNSGCGACATVAVAGYNAIDTPAFVWVVANQLTERPAQCLIEAIAK